MPCLTLDFDPIKGPLIDLALRPPASLTAAGEAPKKFVSAVALIDTGASVTCICTALAKKLALPVMGKTMMTSASGQAPMDKYLADLGIAFFGPSANVNEAHVIPDVVTMEFAGAAHFDILLGRDVLCRGHLSMMGFGNRFMFCI